MWTKFGLKLQKILRCGRPGGGGGCSVISDTPGRGGEGGSKKGKFLRTSFMDGPLCTSFSISTRARKTCRIVYLSSRVVYLLVLFQSP